MKIRVRLTILFTLLTAAILFLFAFVIYYSAKKDREKEFFELLKKEAVTKSNLFLKAKVSSTVLHSIYRNNRQTINEVEVAIYHNHQLLYHDAVEIDFVKETDELFAQIQKKGNVFFYQDKWQVIGMSYKVDGTNYTVTAAALDEYGYSKLDNLFRNIVFIYTISLLLIVVSAFFFTNKAINPVKEIINKAKQISASNLDLRIESKSQGDELAELTSTINLMLQRLENSFESQKSFVSNIAHELRTPLAAIVTELEMALHKTHSSEEYQELIQNALNDTKRIVRLSNSLFDMAKASYDPLEIKFKKTRTDELLLDAVSQIQKHNEKYKVNLSFIRIPEEENETVVNGNEYLLKVAFVNLIENACKYSNDQSCIVEIDFDENEVKIKFMNKGEGIRQEEMKSIFEPFFRGSQYKSVEGQGIGLPLTKKILDLHQGNIKVRSEKNKETIFEVVLKK